MCDKSTWLEALKGEDIRKNIAYNIQRYGTKKTVEAIYDDPKFANCRTENAAQDRRAIHNAIQVCNPKNRDRFNSQKYGAAVADAVRDQLEFAVAEHLPDIEQSLKRMRDVDNLAVTAENIDELKLLRLRLQINEKYRSALFSLTGPIRVYERQPGDSGAGAPRPQLNTGDSGERLPEPPKSLRIDSE